MKRKRLWKRMLAGFIAATVFCGSVPVTEAWAAAPENVAEYDYVKLYSLNEGNVGEYIAGNYRDIETETTREMNYGEMTYLQFALSYNTKAKAELYSADGSSLIGTLYGISYTEHVENIGSELSPEYVEKDGMSTSVIRNNLIYKARNGFYSSLGIIYGISLTGLTLPYGTLDEYYDYYGLEKPTADSLEMDAVNNDKEVETAEDENTEELPTMDNTESSGTPQEDNTQGDETDVIEEPSANEENTQEPAEEVINDQQEASPKPAEEGMDEQKGENAAEAMTEAQDVPLVQAAPANEEASEKTSEEGSTKDQESETEEPADGETVNGEPADEENTNEEPVGESPSGENDKEEESSGENAESVSNAENTTVEGVVTPETDKEELLQEEQELTEEEYPEDFFIPYPNYSVSTFANEEPPEGIIHNYIVWKGQVTGADGSVSYVPPGDYEIRITPLMTSIASHTASLNITIKGSGDGGELTEEDIEKIQQREKEFFPNEHSGFPMLVQAITGDPVDLLSGSLNWSYQDLLIEGKESLDLTRTYVSSMRNRDISGLGNGWMHTYSYWAEIYRQDITVYLPEGGVINYQKEYGGGYKTDEGNEYSLIEDGDGFILSSDRGRTIWFNGEGRATKIEDSDGTVTTLENSGDKLTKVSTDTGSFSFAYDGDRLTSVTDNSGRSVSFEYSGTDLTTVTNPDGDTIEYSYDENHNLLTVKDFNGNIVLENTYDDYWRVATQKMPNRGLMTFSYDTDNKTNSYTEEGGYTKTITYDDKDRITSMTDNAGTEYYSYDDRSRLTSETDKNGGTTSYTYVGDTTQIESITYPDGTAEQYAYNDRGLLTSMVQKDGTAVSFEYDGNGDLIKSTDASGAVRTYTYDERGYLSSSTDALGNTTTYTCDAMGNILTETDPLGNTTTYEYNAKGYLTKQTSPLGHSYSYEYSEAGKLVTETDPLGNTRTTDYNGNGFETAVSDWQGNKTLYTYNAVNDLTSMTESVESVWQSSNW